jgi:hypothetical protein
MVSVRISWGAGEIVVILLSLISYLFGLTDSTYTVSLFLLLSGLWTLVAGLLLVDRRDRTYYSSWGVVVAVLSSFAFLHNWNYTIGLVLIAIVALILLTAFTSRSGKVYTAARGARPAAGDTPAAS